MIALQPGKHLPIKNHIFDSNIIRTGTIADGSCFFHALLHSLKPEYHTLKKDELKQEYVKKIRYDISSSITYEQWKQMNNSYLSLISTSKYFWCIITNYVQYVNEQSYHNSLQSFFEQFNTSISKKIFEIITTELIQKSIEHTYNQYEQVKRQNIKKTTFLDTLNSNMFTLFNNTLSDTEKKYNITINSSKRTIYSNYFSTLITKIYQYSEQKCYNNYINNLSRCDKWINQEKMSILCDYFNIDIYILDGNNKHLLPYNIGGTELYQKRKSIIILYLNNNHFECIGTYVNITVDGKKKPKAIRQFSHTQPLIQKLYTFLCDRETFIKKYPTLKQYLPNQVKSIK